MNHRYHHKSKVYNVKLGFNESFHILEIKSVELFNMSLNFLTCKDTNVKTVFYFNHEDIKTILK